MKTIISSRIGRRASTALVAMLVLDASSSMADAQSGLDDSASASLTANVALTTDYRFRGITQSNGRPAVQGGVDFARRGLYLGLWASSISWLADSGMGRISSNSEWDVYGGWKVRTGDVLWNIGLLYYAYPGRFPTNLNDPDTLEASLSAQINRFSVMTSYALTDFFGFERSNGARYVSISYQLPVMDFGVDLHVGHQRVPSTVGRRQSACSYSDWSLSATRPMGGFDWTVSWVDTTAKGNTDQCYVNSFNKNLGKGSIVLSVAKTL